MTSVKRPELWGGPECTIARIGDSWRNQCQETGHDNRPEDIERLAEMGVRTVRYPILWEAMCPDDPDVCDFTLADERLPLIRAEGMEVIAGLLHHGSGPHYTSLLDPDFPNKLAAYAAKVAARYPWIDKWTPVNEPLTTARFSALYGHWYPHHRTFRSFARALVNQCLGTLRAMQAIRRVNPTAQLVQTEDLGRTFATVPLRYQANYENARRWLSFDLLTGRVGPRQRFYKALRQAGIAAEELAELATGAGRPDIVGINSYLTSERYLDHHIARYDPAIVGGNGRHRYADVEAIRVAHLAGKTGLKRRLREAWSRYGIPMAITEVHHGCTREEQVRWLCDVWQQATEAQQEGIDLRAVTVWAAFGAVDWRSLLKQREGHYDPGAFDIRSDTPRPTLVAHAARALATEGRFQHPVLAERGWWKRSPRLYDWHDERREMPLRGQPIWITGATGTLGQAMARICQHRGLAHRLTSRAECDIADPVAIEAMLDRLNPWAVVNTAGFVRVADAEREQNACMGANAEGAIALAEACARRGIKLLSYSSDLVFDGRAGPYAEGVVPSPTCTYGRSKALAEAGIVAASERHLVVRTSAFFSAWDEYNFAHHVLARLAEGGLVHACPDTLVSPTFVPDLCHASLDLLIDDMGGIVHLANAGAISWHDFARRVAQAWGFDSASVVSTPSGHASNTALVSTRADIMRPFDQAFDDWVNDMKASGRDWLVGPAVAAE